MFVLVLWFIPYYDGNWNIISLTFYGVLFLNFLYDVYKRLNQAHREHQDDTEFTEVKNVKDVKVLDAAEEVPCIDMEVQENK